MNSSLDREISAIDALLANVGLEHGRRTLKRKSRGLDAPSAAPRQSGWDLSSRTAGALAILELPRWKEQHWLLHGFSTRTGGHSTAYRPGAVQGELNLGFTAHDARENVAANREAFVRALSFSAVAHPHAAPASNLITLQQIHSGITYRVGSSDLETPTFAKGDGLMTGEPGFLLGIQTADCIPVLVMDQKRRAVAAFHAGWRGTLKRIVEGGIGRMRLEFGSSPEDLQAVIGPGIGACCYAVGEEVRSEFESQFAYAPELFSEVYDSDPIREKYPMLFLTARAPGHSNIGPALHLDLLQANRRQLLDAGLRPEAIFGGRACTSCDTERFFSYRAERGYCGRMLSVIGVSDKIF